VEKPDQSEQSINGEASTPSEAPLKPRAEIERNKEMDTNTMTVSRSVTPAARTGEPESSNLKENPLKQTATRLESVRDGLKSIISEVNLALSHLKAAERDQKSNEKEIESVRSTLRSLQKVQI
jgi:Ulp1 family protease